ncbi:MAG: double zinc ribbon domain-containing protein [Bacteroidota bacterium]
MQGFGLVDLAGRIIAGSLIGIWIYRDARSRDYTWLMWTLAPIMLLFMPGFAWLLAAFLLVGAYLGTRPRGRLLSCPHCKKRVHEELAFCPYCRRSVKRECLRCHRTVPWEATTCPHCRSAALTDS